MARRGLQAGFTLTELLVTLFIIGVIATVALSYVRSGQRDAETWSDQIARTLSTARLRAVGGRQWYRVTIGAAQITTELAPQMTDGGLPGTPPTSCADATPGLWTVDQSLTRPAPREAVAWKADYASGAPSSPQPVSLKVCFKPDFTQVVLVGTDATVRLNAYVYVSSPVGTAGWRYRVALEGAGVVNVTNPW